MSRIVDECKPLQEAIVEVMDACMKELRRSRHVDTSELTLEAGLFKSFDRVVHRQLDPVWHMAGRGRSTSLFAHSVPVYP